MTTQSNKATTGIATRISTFSEDEFQTLLQDEQMNMYTLERLREAARYGIPNEIRGQVWKQLLKVNLGDAIDSLSNHRRMMNEYVKLSASAKNIGLPMGTAAIDAISSLSLSNTVSIKPNMTTIPTYLPSSSISVSIHALIRNELSLFPTVLSRASTYSDILIAKRGELANVLSVFIAHHTTIAERWAGRLIWICTPVVVVMEQPVDAYFALYEILGRLDRLADPKRLSQNVGLFAMLFRVTQNELCNYLEEEELSINEWALSWIRDLGATCLPLDAVLRLWDTYFAGDDGARILHLFFCLAMLQLYSEQLMELDHTELLMFLRTLPRCPIDQVLLHAYNIRDECYAKKLI